jgi:hypothetical protein
MSFAALDWIRLLVGFRFDHHWPFDNDRRCVNDKGSLDANSSWMIRGSPEQEQGTCGKYEEDSSQEGQGLPQMPPGVPAEQRPWLQIQSLLSISYARQTTNVVSSTVSG